jgi:hypothetical protein
MLSKAEVMQCSHATLMTDNVVECKIAPAFNAQQGRTSKINKPQ